MLKFKKGLKKILKFWILTYFFVVIVEMFFMLVITILGLFAVRTNSITLENLLKDMYIGTLDLLFKSSLVVLFFIMINLIVYIISKVIRIIITFKYQKDIGSNDAEYIREVPSNYSPAIVSLILDKETEPHKDYIATILNLSLKNYIKLEDYGGGRIIYKEYNKPSDINSHERYVYDTLFQHNFFEKDTFNSLVIKDAINLGLIEIIKERKFYGKTIRQIKPLISMAMFFCFLIILKLLSILQSNHVIVDYGVLLGTIIMIICAIVTFAVINRFFNKKIKLTEKGKEDFKNWFKFRRFLEDFTLVNEKGVQDIIIYDKYLVYAISLDRAKNIEKIFLDRQIYKEFTSLNNIL